MFWEVPRSLLRGELLRQEWELVEDFLQKAGLPLHSLFLLSLSARDLSEIPESMTSERQLYIRTSRVPERSAAAGVPILP